MVSGHTTSRRATGPDGEALRREAEILERARHPGVVELVAATTLDGATELLIADPRGRPLAELALSLEEVAGVVVALATTVADLHDIGIAHRGLVADAVTVADDGRVVLDGFASAIRLDGSPASWPHHPAARDDDAAVGELLATSLERCAPAEIVARWEQATRWRLGRKRRRGGVGPAATMRRWAAWAATGTVLSRRLAAGLATDVPNARLPAARRPSTPWPDSCVVDASRAGATDATGRGGEPEKGVDRWGSDPDLGADGWGGEPDLGVDGWGGEPDLGVDRWGHHHPWRGDDATAGSRTATVSAVPVRTEPCPHLAGAAGSANRPPRWPRPFAAAVIAAVTASGIAATVVGHRRAVPTLSGGPKCVAGTKGSSCATYDAGVLAAGAERFAVGQPGDIAALGRWDCAQATLALLRPATGEAWIFGRWPAGDEGVAADPLGRVPDAVRLAVRSKGSCDTLVAVRRDGAATALTRSGP